MRLRPEEAAVRARISVPLNPRPASGPAREPEWGAPGTHLAARSGNAARHPVGLGTEARIEVGSWMALAVVGALCACTVGKNTLITLHSDLGPVHVLMERRLV